MRRTTTLLLAALLSTIAMISGAPSSAGAATEPMTDFAIVRIDPGPPTGGPVGVTASPSTVIPIVHAGDNLRITGWGADLGPDPVVGDSLDLTYNNLAGIRLRRQRCTGVSPDTPFCEFGEVPVGQEEGIILTGRVPKDSKTVSVTFCVSHEAAVFNDPNPANDCMSKTWFVVP